MRKEGSGMYKNQRTGYAGPEARKEKLGTEGRGLRKGAEWPHQEINA